MLVAFDDCYSMIVFVWEYDAGVVTSSWFNDKNWSYADDLSKTN